MSANAIAQKALEGATDALKSKNYVKAIKIIEKGLEILYRNPVMNRNQIAILRQASQDISGSRGITFGMRKRQGKAKSKAWFGFGEDLYNYLVYEDGHPVFTIAAQDEKHAEEKLRSFAESEDKWAKFYNKINEMSITANPYLSALEDKAFFSEKKGVSSQKATNSRLEYLEIYRIGGVMPHVE